MYPDPLAIASLMAASSASVGGIKSTGLFWFFRSILLGILKLFNLSFVGLAKADHACAINPAQPDLLEVVL